MQQFPRGVRPAWYRTRVLTHLLAPPQTLRSIRACGSWVSSLLQVTCRRPMCPHLEGLTWPPAPDAPSHPTPGRSKPRVHAADSTEHAAYHLHEHVRERPRYCAWLQPLGTCLTERPHAGPGCHRQLRVSDQHQHAVQPRYPLCLASGTSSQGCPCEGHWCRGEHGTVWWPLLRRRCLPRCLSERLKEDSKERAMGLRDSTGSEQGRVQPLTGSPVRATAVGG